MKPRPLEGKTALVAGGTRGGGRGIALALGEAGATVYVAGRTRRGGAPPVDGASGTIDDTADDVTARGGEGVPVAVDLTIDDEVRALFARLEAERGGLDVLANAVWGGNEGYAQMEWSSAFWDQPLEGLRHAMLAGPYAYLLASRHAARLMVARGHGLIVHVTDGLAADGSRPWGGPLAWDLPHLLIDRLAVGMSRDLAPRGVCVVALMPGFMRTERVLMHLRTEEQRQQMGFERSETPEYLGRAVAALAADPRAVERSGQVIHVADLARAYGFTDTDGSQPGRFVF